VEIAICIISSIKRNICWSFLKVKSLNAEYSHFVESKLVQTSVHFIVVSHVKTPIVQAAVKLSKIFSK